MTTELTGGPADGPALQDDGHLHRWQPPADLPGDPGVDGQACAHGLAVQDCQPCEEAAIIAGDAPPLTCERCGRSVAGLVADDYELICEGCAGGHTLDEVAVAACDNPVTRVVFGDEIGAGTVVLEPCRGPRLCTVETGRHCEAAAYNDPDRDFHRLTVLRLRDALTAVVADQDGVEQPWRTSSITPVRVLASTLPVSPGDAVAVPEPTPQWAGVPVDPRWDPYRLRMAGPRWWRPWWAASVEYLGAWQTHGDQRIISVRSRSRAGALVDALDALVDHCQWLATGPHADLDLVSVVWLGAQLVPVSQLDRDAADTAVVTR